MLILLKKRSFVVSIICFCKICVAHTSPNRLCFYMKNLIKPYKSVSSFDENILIKINLYVRVLEEKKVDLQTFII